jgi:hypothetical protein
MPRWLKVVLIALGALWLFIAGFSFLILKLF